MRTRTVTAVLDAPAGRVFDRLSDVDNLPKWATEFALSLRRDEEGRAIVTTPHGDLHFVMRADEGTGVIDMLSGPVEDELALFPTRVVPLGEDRSAFVFTMFQDPEMPDEEFDRQAESLEREMEHVRRLVAA